MTYAIYRTTDFSKTFLASVASIDAGIRFLEAHGSVVYWEKDPDGHDTADAAIAIPFGGLQIFCIEKENTK